MRRHRCALIALALLGGALGAAPPASASDGPAAVACTATWAAPGTSGLWNDPTDPVDDSEPQWSPPGVPSADDVVCLPAGAYEVVLGAPATVAGFAVGDAEPGEQPTLRIDGTTLTATGISENHGTVTVTAGAPASAELALGPDGTLHNDGLLELAAGAGGQRRLRGGTLHNAGALVVTGQGWLGGALLSALHLRSTGSVAVSATGSLEAGTAGGGTDLRLLGGTVLLDGPLTGSGSTARLELGGGVALDGPVAPSWAGGTVAITGAATGIVRSHGLATALAGTVPPGLVVEASHPDLPSGWRIPAGTTVTNHGTLRLGGDGGALTRSLTIEGDAVLRNHGVLHWAATGSAHPSATGAGHIINDGTIAVDRPIRWALGGAISHGTVAVAAGADVDASATQLVLLGTVSLGAGARLRSTTELALGDLAIEGDGRLESRGGALGFFGATTGTVWVTNGSVAVTGEVPAGATVEVATAQPATRAELHVQGATTVHGTLRLTAATGSAAWVVLDPGASLAVDGTLDVPVTDGTTEGSRILTGDGPVTITGTATIAGELGRREGPTSLAGDVTVTPTGSLAATAVDLPSGTTTVDGYLSAGELALDGALLTGRGRIAAQIEHTDGTLAPGDAPDAPLEVVGSYDAGPGATVVVSAAGGHLDVVGEAALDGTLAVTDTGPSASTAVRPLVDATLLSGEAATVAGVPASWLAYDRRHGIVRLQPQARFTDVPLDHPFVLEIERAAIAGMVTGFDDGTFRPTEPATRQATVAVLWRLDGAPAVNAVPFPDVPTDHPFHDPIGWARAVGAVAGYPDGTFRPGALISRQALVHLLWSRAGRPAVVGEPPVAFTDVPAEHPFHDAIAWGRSTGLIEGYPDGTFRPTDPVSRQALAAIVDRWTTFD